MPHPCHQATRGSSCPPSRDPESGRCSGSSFAEQPDSTAGTQRQLSTTLSPACEMMLWTTTPTCQKTPKPTWTSPSQPLPAVSMIMGYLKPTEFPCKVLRSFLVRALRSMPAESAAPLQRPILVSRGPSWQKTSPSRTWWVGYLIATWCMMSWLRSPVLSRRPLT